MTGHVGGLPIEELLPTLLSGGGAWLLLRLPSFARRSAPPPSTDPTPDGDDSDGAGAARSYGEGRDRLS